MVRVPIGYSVLDASRRAAISHKAVIRADKFFGLSFGNIFQSGALVDPEHHIAAGDNVGVTIDCQVCDETELKLDLDSALVQEIMTWLYANKSDFIEERIPETA